jgi:GT2 family glycosyltransferase
MPTIDLIVGSVGRLPALKRLFASLAAQDQKDFRVFVLEQADLGGVTDLANNYARCFDISCLPSPRGLSVARNAGLRMSNSPLVAFPDDDCWFPPNLISRIIGKFDEYKDTQLLAGRVVSPNGRPLSQSPQVAIAINRRNVWKTVMSTALFMRRTGIEVVGDFDETLGVGSPGVCQSGEETDYALRVLAAGLKARYEPSLRVSHPEVADVAGRQSALVGWRYGNGMGHVLRRHGYSPVSATRHVGRPLLGAVLAFASGNPPLANFRFSVAAGRLHGYVDSNQRKKH